VGRGICAPALVGEEGLRRLHRPLDLGEDLLTVFAGAVADEDVDRCVGGFVDHLADGFAIGIDAAVFEEVGEAEQRVGGGVVGVADGLVGDAADFLEFVGVDIVARGLDCEGEANERGFLLRGLAVFGQAPDDAGVGAGGQGLGAFDFGCGGVEDGFEGLLGGHW